MRDLKDPKIFFLMGVGFVSVIGFADFLKLVFQIPETNPGLVAVYEKGEYEKESLDALRPYLTTGSTFLDIGAWAGYYSIHASKLVGREGRVIAFEPDPNNFRFLVANVRANLCANTICLPLAVGDTNTAATFWRDVANTGATSGKRESVPTPATSFTSLVVRLDDLFPCATVSAIKSDIQGAELRVLRGAEKLIERCHPVILFEWWPEGIRKFGDRPEDILEWLEKRGYRVTAIPSGERPNPNIEGYCNAIAKGIILP